MSPTPPLLLVWLCLVLPVWSCLESEYSTLELRPVARQPIPRRNRNCLNCTFGKVAENALLHRVSDVFINGAAAPRLGNTSNISFEGVKSQAALMLLDRQGICFPRARLAKPVRWTRPMCCAR